MDDAAFVGFLEAKGDLLRNSHGLINRDRSALQLLREVLAFNELHNERDHAV